MLAEILADPAQRVFHIGDECYIIFGGKTIKDTHSFIRIGNYPELDTRVLDHVAEVVLPHPPLGDPFFERKEISRLAEEAREPVFMGRPEILVRYKELFGVEKLKATKYEQGVSTQGSEQGVYVHYFSDGELEVRVNTRRIFSLRDRAAKDLHYHIFVREAEKLIQRYTRPYVARQMIERGCVMTDSGLFLYQNGELFGVNPPADYYQQLARLGVDPAMMTTAVFPAINTALYRFLSDTVTPKGGKTKFFLPDYVDTAQVQGLREYTQSKAEYHSRQGSGRDYIGDLRTHISEDDDRVSVEIGSGTKFNIYLKKRMWNVYVDTESSHLSAKGVLFTGIPYRWSILPSMHSTALLQEYLPRAFADKTHGLGRQEVGLLNTGLRFLTNRSLSAQRTALRRIRRIRRLFLKKKITPYTYFALHNMHEIAAVLVDERSNKSRAQGTVKSFMSHIRRIMSAWEKADARNRCTVHLPYSFVNLCVTSAGIKQYVAYQWEQDGRIARHDQGISTDIDGLAVRSNDQEFFALERQRLDLLLDELSGKVIPVDESIEDPESEESVRGGIDTLGKQRPSIEYKTVTPAAAAANARKGGPWVKWALIAAGGGAVVAAGIAVIIGISTGNLPFAAGAGSDAPDDTGTYSEHAREGEVDGGADGGVDGVRIDRSARLFGDAYLAVGSPFGDIEITIAEIIAVTNRIAEESGYRKIGDDAVAGPDPDLIFPDGELQLPPDSRGYEVAVDDSIWKVAVGIIGAQVMAHVAELSEINAELADGGSVGAEQRQRVTTIAGETYSGAVRRIAESILADNQ